MTNKNLEERRDKVAKALEQRDLEKRGWRAVAVWGYYRDRAEEIVAAQNKKIKEYLNVENNS